MTIQWPNPYHDVKTLTHANDSVVTKSGNNATITLIPNVTHYPTKDFEVIIEDGTLFEPNIRLVNSTFPELKPGFPSKAASISFIPSFYSWNVQNGRPLDTKTVTFEQQND